MEPITVESNLDIKTYYKISLSVIYRTSTIIVILFVFIAFNIFCFYDNKFNWIDEMVCIGVIVFPYGIFLPLMTWGLCKRNIKVLATLAEPTTYHIYNERIEGIRESSSESSNWKYVTKAIEKDNYFLLFSSSRMFRYLPKAGFASVEDIARFKDIVKGHRIRAYFK